MDLDTYLKSNLITQTNFAKAMDISLIHAQGIIRGRNRASVKLAKRIEAFSEGQVSRLEILYAD